MNVAHPDPSTILPFEFKINRQADIYITLLQDGDPIASVTGWTWALSIKRYPGSRTNLINLTLGNGLSYDTYSEIVLHAHFTSAQCNIDEGEYFIQLTRTDIEKTWIEGVCNFRFAKVNSQEVMSSELTLDINSDTQDITLNIISGRIITITEIGTSYTFSNGLTESGGAVKLGDTLTENTTINPGLFELKIGGTFAYTTFRNSPTNNSFNLNPVDDDPTGLISGDIWINSGGQLRASIAGVTYTFAPLTAVVGLQDLYIPAVAMWPRTTDGCAALSKTEIATSLVNIQTLDFDQTTREHAQFSISFPKNWNRGAVTAKFYWTAASGSGTVDWEIQATAYSNDDALSIALGSNNGVIDTLITANDLHISDSTAAITIAGFPQDSDFLVFQIYRDVANDTLTADAKLIGVVIQLTTDAAVSS